MGMVRSITGLILPGRTTGQLAHHGGVGLGLALGKVAPEHAHDGRALEQRQVERQGPGWGRTQTRPPDSGRARRGERGLGMMGSPITGPLPSVRDLDGLAQVVLAVDGRVGPDGECTARIFVAGGRSDHACPMALAIWMAAVPARHAPAPARSRLRLRAVQQRVVRRGVDHVDTAASTCENRLAGHAGRPGATVWVPKPPVPDRQARSATFPGCVTPSPTAATTPAYSEPGHKGQRRLHLVLVLHDEQVGEVQAGGLDLDEHLARLGGGVGSSVQVSASTPVGLVQSQACMGKSPVGRSLSMMARMIGGAPACWMSHERRAPGAPSAQCGQQASVSGAAVRHLQSVATLAQTMKILISNDDGFQAPASWRCADTLKTLDRVEVEVVAPEHNNSAQSNALTLRSPLYVHRAAEAFAT